MSFANRDEAVKCLRIAENSLRIGNKDKASRFAEKSIRLYPTEEAKVFLNRLQQLHEGESESEDDESSGDHTFSEGVRRRGAAAASKNRSRSRSKSPRKNKTQRDPDHAESSPGADEENYSAEQGTMVKKILSVKSNYYKVMQLDQNSFSESELKKKYRKLALVVHPDKNKAPQSGEAFKVVGAAYSTLSVDHKRREYDQLLALGRTEEGFQTSSSRSGHQYASDDISPDDIFNMFFGGDPNFVFQRRGGAQWGARTYTFHSGARAQRRYRDEERDPTAEESLKPMLMHLMPVIILVLMSALTHFLQPDPIWSFTPSTRYNVPLTTSNYKVQYYMNDGYLKELSSSDLLNIESQVEASHLSNLRNHCVHERQQKETMMWRAKLYADVAWQRKAQQMPTPSCDALNEIYAK